MRKSLLNFQRFGQENRIWSGKSQGIFFMTEDGHLKSPKISYTKVADKMAYANSADPDEGEI